MGYVLQSTDYLSDQNSSPRNLQVPKKTILQSLQDGDDVDNTNSLQIKLHKIQI